MTGSTVDARVRRTRNVPVAIASLFVLALAVVAFSAPTGGTVARAQAPPPIAGALAPGHAASSLAGSTSLLQPPHASTPGAFRPSTPGPAFGALGSFSLPGPHPAAWGSAGLPPGAEALQGILPHPASSGGSAANGTAPWQNRFCSGLWPWASNDSASQALYWDGCYGHDEPGVQSYSPLPGSGGNVSWNVTLPIDRNGTANQSDLYVAIWFGLTLNDPLAWMHQCFLELQFYPDQTFTNGPGLPNPAWTVNGAWIGAAVAWQIEAATGYEDPCFYQPLFNGSATGGASYFNMSQGDHLTVTFTGYGTSPTGENLTIDDLTTGTSSYVTLWDYAGNYPLNPSYGTNTYENGLQWTPGGEYPAVFAFENGHAGNPVFPSSNPYGGCSPGKPPASLFYPSVPCPSYDPGSWANDTLVPWHIGVPTFFNAQSRDTHPAQVAFTQDFGGVGAISDIGQGACDGQLGSAWCSYPWYSYSCAAQAFEFGATDYPGVSADFGQYDQYSPVLESNGLGFGYFPPTNFSMPTCGAKAYNITVATSGVPGGAVYFLSQPEYAPTNVTDLLPGNYSIAAVAPGGDYFQDWTTTGGVTILGGRNDSSTTLRVASNGSVTAWFTTSPTLTNVTFEDVGTSALGSVVVSPARTYTNGIPLAVVSNGTTLHLAPGVYGVQALPPMGANFTAWSTEGAGISLAPSQFPYAWLDVDGIGGNVTLTAQYAPSTALDWALVLPEGFGAIVLNGTSYNSSASVGLPVGAYPLEAIPAPGWGFAGWGYGSSAVMTDFAASTFIDLENSASFNPTYIVAYFSPVAVYNVELDDNPSFAGTSAIGPSLTGIPSGGVVPSYPGYTSVTAFPNGGWRFVGWSVNNSSAAWIFSPNASYSFLQVNGSVTIEADYVLDHVGAVHFHFAPTGAGIISFNAGPFLSADTTNSSVANGTYAVAAYPGPGYYFQGFLVNGTATLGAASSYYLLSFVAWVGPAGTTGDANLTAVFGQLPPPPPPGVPVTFVATQPTGATVTLAGSPIASGTTVWLLPGSYALTLTLTTASASFDGWATTPGLTIGSPLSLTASVVVTTEGGTITAILAPFGVAGPSALPNPTEVGSSTTLSGSVNGTTGPYAFQWLGLPSGCASTNASSISCSPSSAGTFGVRLTATDVYGVLGLSPATTVTVVRGLSVVSVAGGAAAVDVGVATTIATTIAGGVAPFSYNYTAWPSGCTPTSGASFSCTPDTVGTASLAVTVTDGLNVIASGTGSLTVNAAPSVSAFGATPSTTDVGVATTFTAVVAAGTGPFTYSYGGLPSGCTTSNTATLACTPLVAGSATVTVTVTDADGLSASASTTLTVNPAPTVTSFLASPPAIDVGLTTVLTAVASGGTGTFNYSYAGLPAGCASTNALTLTCVPSTTGTSTVTFTARDAIGGHGSAGLTLVVNPKPAIGSATFAPATVDEGSATTLTVSASGGTGALTYAYGGLPSGCSSSDTATLSCTPSGSGTFTVSVTVTDTLGVSANASAVLTVQAGAGGGILGLPGVLGYVVIAVIVLVVVGLVAMLLLRGRKARSAPSAPPAAPSETPAPASGGTPSTPEGPSPPSS